MLIFHGLNALVVLAQKLKRVNRGATSLFGYFLTGFGAVTQKDFNIGLVSLLHPLDEL